MTTREILLRNVLAAMARAGILDWADLAERVGRRTSRVRDLGDGTTLLTFKRYANALHCGVEDLVRGVM